MVRAFGTSTDVGDEIPLSLALLLLLAKSVISAHREATDQLAIKVREYFPRLSQMTSE